MRVVVTGAGAVGPFGHGVARLVEGLLAGRPSLVLREVGPRAAVVAAVVPEPIDPGPFAAGSWRRLDRASRMAAFACAEALSAAGLGPAAARKAGGSADVPDDLGVVLGTMTAGAPPLQEFLETYWADGAQAVSPMLFPFTVPNAPASQCSILLGLRGPNLTLCAMEGSGLAAIALGADLIRSGAVRAILAGGVDDPASLMLAAWRRLRVAARGEAASFRGPFDRRRRGFAPGAGAYVVLLESLGEARRRGVHPLAEIRGAATAHAGGEPHRYPDDPAVPSRAYRQALERAGIAPEQIGAVVASASGARRLDRLDAAAIARALGAGGRRVPVTAIKGAIGESGAASAAAVIAGLGAIRDGVLPPVAALEEPDPDTGLNLVVGAARRAAIPSVLAGSIATGGGCAALVLSRTGS
jgi:3-oxoacyl-[acyl-carrier-protein] synthase II